MPPISALIFDLDGTLIDSSRSILAAFTAVLDEKKLTSRVPLDHTLIGPPLTATLKRISGLENAAEIDQLVTAFKAHYDSSGYRDSDPITGTDTLLAELKRRGHPLYIVTNKRRHPTFLILAYLGWNPFFEDVRTLDSASPPYPSKAAALSALILDHGLKPAQSAYIGDTPEDADAAKLNGVPFFQVAWGYGIWPAERFSPNLGKPADLLDFFPAQIYSDKELRT